MNFSQLAYFDAAVRCGSLTEAARELYVTQQAVSAGIGSLERELGVRLLERRPERIRLTLAGQEVLDETHTVLDAVARMRTSAAIHRDGIQGTVSFAYATSTVGTSSLRHPNQEDLTSFAAGKPNMNLRMFEAASDACLALLSQKTADVALVAGQPDCETYQGVLLCCPELVLCVPARHPFAEKDGQLSYDALRGVGQYLPPDLNYSLRITDKACHAWGFNPTYIEQPAGGVSQLDRIASGHGVAFMPDGYEPAISDERLRLVHMCPEEACHVPLWLAWLKDDELDSAARALVDFLQGMFKQ